MQIEGRNPVFEALKAGTKINELLIESKAFKKDKLAEIYQIASQKHIKIRTVSRSVLNKFTQTGIHQGVIALGEEQRIINFSELLNRNNCFLIYIREALYEHNIGAIIRTAECAGATAIILPPKISITPQIRRASMGATEHIPILSYNLFQAIKEAKDAGLPIIGIERSNSSTMLYHTKLEKPLMVIIGGEDRSLSPEILKKCDKTVEIPMKGEINSLNMSVAAAIVIYEVVRQEILSK